LNLFRGYAVVAQDCRGTFDSEGLFRTFLDDGWGENKDGYDTVLWVLDQPWCNGKIGTVGGSARGITQNMLAGSAPPGLMCQYIGVAASDLYSQAMFHDGAFRKRLVEGWVAGRGVAAYTYMMNTLTVAWFCRHGYRLYPHGISIMPWYRHKRTPSFANMLQLLRNLLRQERFCNTPENIVVLKNPRDCRNHAYRHAA